MKAEVLEFSMNNEDRNVALDGAIAQIEKNFGKELINVCDICCPLSSSDEVEKPLIHT